jgi:hypothetical protein
MVEDYFVVRSGEDRTVIEKMSKDRLTKLITPDENGDTDYGKNITFLNTIPDNDDGYWIGVPNNSLLIIKGEIIIPKAVKVVIKMEL